MRTASRAARAGSSEPRQARAARLPAAIRATATPPDKRSSPTRTHRHPRMAALQTNERASRPCHFDTLCGICTAMTSAASGRSHFRMIESFDEAGVLRLSLIGELDLAVADELANRLRQLEAQGLEVRLDLTKLEFIDSTGLRELVCALDGSRRNGSWLTVGTDMTRAVRHVVELVGVGSSFLPDGR
jgi:anti-sigma B factor antagonist